MQYSTRFFFLITIQHLIDNKTTKVRTLKHLSGYGNIQQRAKKHSATGITVLKQSFQE